MSWMKSASTAPSKTKVSCRRTRLSHGFQEPDTLTTVNVADERSVRGVSIRLANSYSAGATATLERLLDLFHYAETLSSISVESYSRQGGGDSAAAAVSCAG